MDNLIKDFQRKGYLSEREGFVLRSRATRDVQELGTLLLTGYFVNSSKSSYSVVSTRGAGTAPLFHGKVTD
jgi:hypothetical protein